MQRWLAEQANKRAEKKAAEPPAPVVTISREAGSRGTTVGSRVAKALGFEFWDQELVQRIAEHTGASETLFRTCDERTRNAIEVLLGAVLTGDAVPAAEYFTQLVRVVHAIGQHGRAVLIGRGAQFILAPDRTLRVRVISPIEDRVSFMAEWRGLDKREARREVDRIDQERAAFMRVRYKRDVTDPSSYDLLVNTGTLDLDASVDVIVAAYRAKFGK